MNIKGFDVTKCLPFDIMHTIFEGGARLHLQRLLFHLIDSSGYITLAQLNTRITAHPYGYLETDTKPGPIEQDSSGSYRVSQSGMDIRICM